MVVRWATRPNQETIVGTLATLPGLIAKQGLRPPATIVIGEVVSLRDRFNWFERLPLFGQRIVITRDHRQSRELAEPLEALGAEVIALPVIEIQAPADPAPLARAMAQLETYDWIIFTSVNGVRRFVSSLEDIRKLRAKIAAIGPATQAAVEALHLKADIVPAEYVAESLLDALAGEDLKGRRILLPRAAVARDVVPAELAKRGAIVDVAEAYRTEATAGLAERAREVLARKPHWITFTSSSTVKNFASVASVEGMKIASIGPITSATARELGMHVDVEADPHTMAGLVAAIQSK
jgi:uroporphyrinogen III methyltransferase/synthase